MPIGALEDVMKSIITVASFLIFVAACEQESLHTSNNGRADGTNPDEGVKLDSDKDKDIGSETVPGDKGKNTTNEDLKIAKASLAVRGPACLMCHAEINSNMVTDLGHGDSFFMGGPIPANEFDAAQQKAVPGRPQFAFGGSMYSNWGGSWATATIKGDLFVPDVDISGNKILGLKPKDAASNHMPANSSIRDFLTIPVIYNYWDQNPTNRHEFVQLQEQKGLAPGVVAYPQGIVNEIVEVKEIQIKSPRSGDIQKIIDSGSVTSLGAQGGVSVYTTAGTQNQGFNISAVGNGKSAVKANGNVTCEGDVVIKGNVWFNNVTITSPKDKQPCRLYVDGSVFVTGEIKYGAAGHQTLQLASTEGILFGMKTTRYRTAHFHGLRGMDTIAAGEAFYLKIHEAAESLTGLVDDAGPYRGIYKRIAGQPDQILAYAQNVPRDIGRVISGDDFNIIKPILKDANTHAAFNWEAYCGTAATTAGGYTCAVDWTKEFGRKTVNQSGLLLNAPVVWSRYFGQFKGVVIAETALFAVGKFKFEYDDSFESQSIFPLLDFAPFKMVKD